MPGVLRPRARAVQGGRAPQGEAVHQQRRARAPEQVHEVRRARRLLGPPARRPPGTVQLHPCLPVRVGLAAPGGGDVDDVGAVGEQPLGVRALARAGPAQHEGAPGQPGHIGTVEGHAGPREGADLPAHGQGGPVGVDLGPPGPQPLDQLGGGRVVVRQVGGHDPGRGRDGADVPQPRELGGEGDEVQVPGAVVGGVAEGLLEHDEVVGAVGHPGQGGVAERGGVGGVEQAGTVGAGDVPQQRRDLVGPRHRAAAVALQVQVGDGVVGADGDQRDRVVGADPVRVRGDGVGRAQDHERFGAPGPGPPQQGGGGGVVGVGVGDQHHADPGQVRPGPQGGPGGLGAAVQEQDPVEQGGTLTPDLTAGACPQAGRAGAERVGPAVRRPRAEQAELAHRPRPGPWFAARANICRPMIASTSSGSRTNRMVRRAWSIPADSRTNVP